MSVEFPITVHYPDNTTQTVRVSKRDIGNDAELFVDRLGRTYRRRGEGRLGVVPCCERETPAVVVPAPAPVPGMQDERNELTAFLRKRRAESQPDSSIKKPRLD